MSEARSASLLVAFTLMHRPFGLDKVCQSAYLELAGMTFMHYKIKLQHFCSIYTTGKLAGANV